MERLLFGVARLFFRAFLAATRVRNAHPLLAAFVLAMPAIVVANYYVMIFVPVEWFAVRVGASVIAGFGAAVITSWAIAVLGVTVEGWSLVAHVRMRMAEKGITRDQAVEELEASSAESSAPRVFISYKWNTEPENLWVQRLAHDLRHRGIDALLDRWEVRFGDSFTDYMTSRIGTADVVLFVITAASVRAVEAPDGRGGAVKFEMQMATARRTAGEKMRLIGVYREGSKAPAHIRDHRYVDFRDDTAYARRLDELVADLLGTSSRPPLVRP